MRKHFSFNEILLEVRAMAQLKFSILVLLCSICTLTSAYIGNELNFFSNNVPSIHHARQIRSNIDDLVTADYKEIADRFENTVDACNDAYSIVCTGNPVNENETISLKTIKKSILDALDTPVSSSDWPLLKIEKNLFQSCMKLGEEDYYTKEQTLADFEYVVHRIYSHITHHTSWQSLDEFLSALGFGHTFYQIKVESDPENYVNNIVTLQPPSHVHVERMYKLIMKILNNADRYAHGDGWNIWKFFQVMKKNKHEIGSFFTSLLEIISSGKNSHPQHKHVEKTTLNFWKKNNLYTSNVAQINWTSIISQEFERVNVEIDPKEILLIKNEQYFLNLYDLLNSNSDDLISSVILTKLLAEELPYIDWKNFHTVNPTSKEEFCFGETKLYGASFKVLKGFQDHNVNGISSRNTLNTLNNIESVINADISESHTLTAKQRRYLRNYLTSMTRKVLQRQDEKAVAGYYEDYQTIGIYFNDILNYRKMIRNKELSTLRDAPQNEMELFSIIDLYKPRNRLLTKLMTINLKIEVPTHRVIYYSKHAADIAHFLYSLLNENRFADYKYDFDRTDSQLYTNPIFSASIIDCYSNSVTQGENKNKKFIKHMLTTMFGLHIAYEAMLNDYAVIGESPESIHISEDNWISHDKMFFISYLKNHCSLGSNVVNEIFSKSDFIRTSTCNNRPSEAAYCNQDPFGIQSKHIFLA